jgi:energy-coupling factor transporter ATP-binding protein EcfA2
VTGQPNTQTKAGGGFDRQLERGIDEAVESAGRWWFVWLPPSLFAVAVWGWWHEAWIGPEGWDTVRRWLWVAGAVAVVAVVVRVWWVARSMARRKAKVRTGDALKAVGIEGSPVITNQEGTAGYVKRDPDAPHFTEVQRKRLETELSRNLPTKVAVGEPDDKGRIPFRPAVESVERDRLAATIPALPYPERVDLSRLSVGLRDDGSPFLLSLAKGRHTFVVGATGAGKGSVIQSIVRALAPAIHAGTVRVIFVDPKGGAEGLPIRKMCHTVMVGTGKNVEQVAGFLDGLSNEVVADALRLASQGKRAHVATVQHPFTIVIIDEIASLTKYMGTSQTQRMCEQAVGALTTMGRSAGWGIIGAVQDPRKEVVSIRGLFPQRVALRLSEEQEVDWVLGHAARERGANCHLIPLDREGTAYLTQDGNPEPTKVRFSYPTDDDLADVVERFPAPDGGRVLGLPEGFFG